MVFYIIAASDKVNGKQVDAGAVRQKIVAIPSFVQRGNQAANKLVDLKVKMDSFKLGSLDQLMSLNESSAKLDQILDKTCKKFEKICFETGSAELKYIDAMDERRILSYREYIEQFEWDFRKYNVKMPLGDLCQTIAKVSAIH